MTDTDTMLGRELAKFKRLRGPLFWLTVTSASLASGMGAGAVVNTVRAEKAAGTSVDISLVRAALKLRLPHTPIGAINCVGLGGVCEVVAGATLFYVDQTARYLMIGRLYDMEARSDLTATRLLALNPDLLVGGGAHKQAAEDEDRPTSPARVMRVDLAELPSAGAIRWGPADGPRLIVLSDFACGYCRRLTGELKLLGARVEEHPISIFGPESRRKAEEVLCAHDPVAALHAAYDGQPITATGKCDVSGLDANETFARKHGFGGTPVIIRADGTVLQGFRPAATLKVFLNGGAA